MIFADENTVADGNRSCGLWFFESRTFHWFDLVAKTFENKFMGSIESGVYVEFNSINFPLHSRKEIKKIISIKKMR